MTAPEHADGEAGSGEGLAVHDLVGYAEHLAELSGFVFEELAQGLDQREAHALRKAADVVVALDRRRRALEGYRLDHVRVERALREEAHVAQGRRFLLEHLDESGADDAPLLLGILHAGQALEESLGSVDVAQIEVEAVAAQRHDLLCLASPQQAVVDEDAGELITNGLVDQRGDHGRVDAAGETADDPVVADAGANARRLRARRSPPWSSRRARRRRERGSSPEPRAHGAYARPRGGTALRRNGASGPRKRRSASCRCAQGCASPGGSASILSPWLIQTRMGRGSRPAKRSLSSSMLKSARPYSRRCARATAPPSNRKSTPMP